MPMALSENAKPENPLRRKRSLQKQNRYAGKDSNRHLGCGSDPIVVEGQLQEIRQPNQHRDNANPIQPLSADARLQRSVGLGKACLLSRDRCCTLDYGFSCRRYRNRRGTRHRGQARRTRFRIGLDERRCLSHRFWRTCRQQLFQAVDPAGEFRHLLAQAF